MSKKIKILSLILLFALLVTGCGFGCKKESDTEKVNLTVWQVWDEKKVFEDLINTYEKENKNIKITYIKKDYQNFEKDFIDALAEEKGPDIISIHNDWIPEHKGKLVPCPIDVISPVDFKMTFVDVAGDELISEVKIIDPKTKKETSQDQVYAVPLSVDTLALYYNKDLLNSAHISRPPYTWEELREMSRRLTSQDRWGNIIKSGVALGTSTSISRSADILQMIMLQKNTIMVDIDKKEARFNRDVKGKYPGRDALDFYTSFALPKSENYTYNRALGFSTDGFPEGKVVMMLGYSYMIDTLKMKAPGLNYGVAEAPQESIGDEKITFPNYWPLAVTNNSKYPGKAWGFIKWLTERENLKVYYTNTNLPPSRRDLISFYENDEKLSIFSSQALTAKSWYKIDSQTVEEIFNTMISDIVLGKETVEGAINKGAEILTQLMRTRE